MTKHTQPRFPIYIPSKSRADTATTPRFLDSIGVEYRLVIEKQQYKTYLEHFKKAQLLVLEKSYQDEFDPWMELDASQSKGSGPARNFIWEHSIREGHDYHWTMDDNIRFFARLHKNKRVPIGDGTVFNAMENFVLRYKNIGMAGPQYWMFAPSRAKLEPFITGTRIYSCNLIRNDVPMRWRGRYNEDTDLSLRMLKAGWNTVLFNAFLQYKITTQQMGGGNTEAFYAEEGTLKKSQMLVDMHPDVTKLSWKFGRAHHHVDYSRWLGTPLVKRDDYDPSKAPDYKLKLIKRTTETPVVDEKKAAPPKSKQSPAAEEANKHAMTKRFWELVDNRDDLSLPRYPIYVPSRGRSHLARAPQLLEASGLDYILVVEPQDSDDYKKAFPNATKFVLGKSNAGLSFARRACKADAKANGAGYHWQIDDDIRKVSVQRDKKEQEVPIAVALAIAEALMDEFENIGGLSLRHINFSRTEEADIGFNRAIHSASLISTEVKAHSRDNTVGDPDITLQLLNEGTCTIVLNRLVFSAPAVGAQEGGLTDYKETARKRAENTQALWPGVFKIKEDKARPRLAPSRIWSSFPQRPTPKSDKS